MQLIGVFCKHLAAFFFSLLFYLTFEFTCGRFDQMLFDYHADSFTCWMRLRSVAPIQRTYEQTNEKCTAIWMHVTKNAQIMWRNRDDDRIIAQII